MASNSAALPARGAVLTTVIVLRTTSSCVEAHSKGPQTNRALLLQAKRHALPMPWLLQQIKAAVWRLLCKCDVSKQHHILTVHYALTCRRSSRSRRSVARSCAPIKRTLITTCLHEAWAL